MILKFVKFIKDKDLFLIKKKFQKIVTIYVFVRFFNYKDKKK